MRTFFLLIMGGFLSTSLYSYDFRVKNSTDGQLYIQAAYSNCPSDSLLIAPGKVGIIYAGSCCVMSVEVRGMSGPVKGKTLHYVPTLTGPQERCSKFEFTVSPASNNDLITSEGL